MSKACTCDVCQYRLLFKQHIESLTGEAKIFFEDMYERLCMAENDAAFNDYKRKEAEEKLIASSWAENPDRSGGQFTQEEVDQSARGGYGW